MLHSKVLLITGAEVFFVAFLVSYFNVDVPVPQIWPFNTIGGAPKQSASDEAVPVIEDPTPSEDGDNEKVERATKPKSERKKKSRSAAAKSPTVDDDDADDAETDDEPSVKIFTPKELSLYDGLRKSKGLYLAVMGKVFDVKRGSKHYGPKGGYHFFAGKDATRAFVTGDFTESGAVADITGLTNQDVLGIEEWMSFYEKQYTFVGYVSGHYYDTAGQPTKKLKAAEKAIRDAHVWRKKQADESSRFPPCNSEWNQGNGGRIWCTTKSGGIIRDWVGVPRKLFLPGTKSSRCACVKTTGPPLDAEPDAPHKNRGDLDHPSLQEYADCNPDAISCALPNDE